jgi:hypothetical protein
VPVEQALFQQHFGNSTRYSIFVIHGVVSKGQPNISGALFEPQPGARNGQVFPRPQVASCKGLAILNDFLNPFSAFEEPFQFYKTCIFLQANSRVGPRPIE